MSTLEKAYGDGGPFRPERAASTLPPPDAAAGTPPLQADEGLADDVPVTVRAAASAPAPVAPATAVPAPPPVEPPPPLPPPAAPPPPSAAPPVDPISPSEPPPAVQAEHPEPGEAPHAPSVHVPAAAPVAPPAAARLARQPRLAELAARIRASGAARERLRPVGGASKSFLAPSGSASATQPLLLGGFLGQALIHQPSELVVTAQAGLKLVELEAALAAHGQALAFEPPRLRDPGRPVAESRVTVGGMVAAGLAGPARMRAGSLRDHLLGLGLMDGRGELLSFGGQVMKNVAGYDVSRVLAGSWGRLGIITEVSLKVLPRPPAMATLRFELAEAQALEQLARWSSQPWPLDASAWWDGMLVVRLAGADAAVAAARRAFGGDVLEAAVAEAFWADLRDQQDEFFEHARRACTAGAGRLALWRLAVPPTTPPLDLPASPLIEWVGGQRWVLTDAPAAQVHAAAAAVGGHARRWRGQGAEHGPAPDAITAAIEQRLRAAFDPAGVFSTD